MSDIFISYASEDRQRAHALANVLLGLGYSVWWDHDLLGGEQFGDVIERELGLAKWAIVLWSEHAKKSIWVKSEATKALERGMLIPARIDNVEIPLPFGSVHTIDLSNWSGEDTDDSFLQLRNAINKRVGIPAVLPPRTIIAWLFKFVHRHRAVISIAGLALAAYLMVLLYPHVVVADLYAHPGGSFERRGSVWVEYPEYSPGQNFKFSSTGFDTSYLYLVDSSRHKPGDTTRVFYMRLPLKGGMAQWSYPNPYIWQDLYMVTPKSPNSGDSR
jgi:hypothetical protein